MRGRCERWDAAQQHETIQTVNFKRRSSEDVRLPDAATSDVFHRFHLKPPGRHTWLYVRCLLSAPDSDWGGDELLCEDGASPGEDHCDRRLLLLQPPPPQDRALSGSVALGGDWRLFSCSAVGHRGSLRLFCKPPPRLRPPVASFQFASVDIPQSFSSSPSFIIELFKAPIVRILMTFILKKN